MTIDPHIRFFQVLNPGHLKVDKLVCFTEIYEENLTIAGRRMWFAHSKSLDEIQNSTLKIPA